MGKDRFSRFKRENYDSSFRYGDSTYVRSVKKEERLSSEQRDWLVKVIKSGLISEWDMDFLRRILYSNKIPTKKQKRVILKIHAKTLK